MKVEAKVKMIIEKMRNNGSLPAINENVHDIAKLAMNSKTSAADLSAVIMRDCGLTSNLLTTANSTFYSPRNPIKTVSLAVSFLGFEKVRALALGLSIFQQNQQTASNSELMKLYANSYFSGSLAMSLANESSYGSPEEIFVVGLLYKLPELALAHTFPDLFKEMEDMIQENDEDPNTACQKVFGVEYDQLCEGLNELYKLPGKVSEVLKKNPLKVDPMLSMVHEAGVMASMLFGDQKGGKEEIVKVERKICKLLKKESFSLTDFIRQSCKKDKNIERFFNLKEDDIEMMVNILEWGKADPSQVISKLSLGNALEPENRESTVEPEIMIGHFLTELTMMKSKGKDINQVIMLAQEALYRCIIDSSIFTTFIDRKNSSLTGRFYAGANLLVEANDFHLSLKSDSPIIKSLNSEETVIWNAKKGSLQVPPVITKRVRPIHSMFRPVTVNGKPIGLYFLTRSENREFTEREEIWFDEIVRHVEDAFVRFRRSEKKE